MRAIFDYFVSAPEAIATLLVFVIGGIATLLALVYPLLVRDSIVVRHLGTRGLVRIDPVLRANIRVSFQRGGASTEIRELRQIDFEIYNSHPKKEIKNRSITINLPAVDTRILGITAANSDHRLPHLGGRSVESTIGYVPAVPSDPLFAQDASKYPAVVIRIPNLDGGLRNDDRVFIRITYDGPYVQPKIQGAKLETKNTYAAGQQRTVDLLVLVLIVFAVLLKDTLLPLIFVVLIATTLLIVGFFKKDWILKWSRPLPSLLARPPLDHDALSEFHYYDCLGEL